LFLVSRATGQGDAAGAEASEGTCGTHSSTDWTTPHTSDPLGIGAPPASADAWTSESRSETGAGGSAWRPRPERGVPPSGCGLGGPSTAADSTSPTARSLRRSGGWVRPPDEMAAWSSSESSWRSSTPDWPSGRRTMARVECTSFTATITRTPVVRSARRRRAAVTGASPPPRRARRPPEASASSSDALPSLPSSKRASTLACCATCRCSSGVSAEPPPRGKGASSSCIHSASSSSAASSSAAAAGSALGFLGLLSAAADFLPLATGASALDFLRVTAVDASSGSRFEGIGPRGGSIDCATSTDGRRNFNF